MDTFIVLFFIVFIIIISFFVVVLFLQIKYKFDDIETERKRKMYKDLILEFCLNNGAELKTATNKLKNAIRKIDDDFVFVAINFLNEFEGDFRKKIINFLEVNGVSDYIYDKLINARSRTYRRLYTFEIGEIRSRKYFTYLLSWSKEYIIKYNLYSPYVFAISTISNEWINELDEKTVKTFLDKIFEIIVVVETQENWNVKRVLEYLLNDGTNLFNYFLRNDKMRQYFYQKLSEDKTTLKTKGEIIYVLAFNQEYDVIDLVTMEFFKYCDIEEKNKDEFEYLVNLTKAAGMIETKESLKVLYRASKDENWVLRAQSAKYLAKHNEEEVKEILYGFLSDPNWWVRLNAAEGIKSFGEEGYYHLFMALTSDDKYAREVAAYGLSNSDYLERCIKLIKINGIEGILKEILVIINNANNINLLDELIIEKSISNEDKIRIIQGVKSERFFEYFNDAMKYRKIDKEVYNAAQERISKMFLEEDE